jgi:hypothetical protein
MAAVRSRARLLGVTEAISCSFYREDPESNPRKHSKEASVLSILWIILIVVLVLALLGFFSRGAW